MMTNYPGANYTFYPSAGVLPPYLSGRAHIGINIADHAGVNVGAASTSAGVRNIFDNLTYGIHGVNSNVYVVNSLFIYIQEQCTGIPFCFEPFQVSTCPPGTAVCTGSSGPGQGPAPRTTKVGIHSSGPATLYPNYFESDQYGIYNSANRNLDARNNQFKLIDHTGIYNAFSSNYLNAPPFPVFPSNTIYINGNSMDRAQTGVHLNDNRNAVMVVSANEFNYSGWSTATTQQSISGIIVNNAVVHTVGSLGISSNNMANLQKGITLTMQGYNGTGTTNRVQVRGNQIRFNQLQTSTVAVQHYGIGIFACKRIMIDGDLTAGEIIRVTAAPATYNTQLQRDLFSGVRIESSAETWVTDMSITATPGGIYVKVACASSNFWCNILTSTFNGFYFNNANISNQLNLASPYNGAATGNQWFSTVATGNKIAGAISPAIIWRYNIAAPASYNPLPSGLSIGSATFSATDNPNDACNYQLEPEDPPINPDERVAGTNPKNYVSENTANNQNTAREIESSPLERYPAYLDSMGTEAAAVYNSEIIATTDAEAARKQVDEIHLRSWALGSAGFTAADSAYLCALAAHDPSLFGDAVYSAIVMVGECPAEELNTRFGYSQYEAKEEQLRLSPAHPTIYPNPNNGLMQVNIKLKNNEQGMLEICNLNGTLLSSYILKPGQNEFVIDENNLQAGIYLYRIVVNGANRAVNKLVIVK